jgi:hypothetical protein
MTKIKLTKTIHNAETGEIIEREFTKEEYQQYEIDASNITAIKAEIETKAAQKQALLDKLGIDANEAKLLLG